MKKISTRNKFRIIWFTIVFAFMCFQWSSYQSKGFNHNLLNTTSEVSVEEDHTKISFIAKEQKKLEILFFPGGLVDPKSYIPLGRSIGELGYNFHIIKMPWRMSTKGYNNIKNLFDLNQNKDFILGGHSQGGKMAAQFVFENPTLMSGLMLLGTSHPRDIDLSNIDIPTIKIYAELDGLASVQEVLENQNKLPKRAELKLIQGGNHSQFGYFGRILFDKKATISRKEQHLKQIYF